MSTLTQPRAPHGGAALTAMDRWPLARPDTLFWAWCALHVLAWTIGPALMYSSVPRDTLEGITWGQMWQWGYEKHPPLAAWISALFTQVGGECCGGNRPHIPRRGPRPVERSQQDRVLARPQGPDA